MIISLITGESHTPRTRCRPRGAAAWRRRSAHRRAALGPAVFNSCFINRGYSCGASTFVSQGPLASRTTLSRRDRAWAPDVPCATLPATIYCLSCSCSCSRSWPSPILLSHPLLTIPFTLRLFTLVADLGDLAAGPDAARRSNVSFLRVRIALTTFARREQRRTSRRHSDLSSLPGREHDYDLLTWTTVSESGHRGVWRWISAVLSSQIEGMKAAKSRFFLSLAFAAGSNAEEMPFSLAIAETRYAYRN